MLLAVVADLFILLIGRVLSVLLTRFGGFGEFWGVQVLLGMSIWGSLCWGFCAKSEFGLLILGSILGMGEGEGEEEGEIKEILVVTWEREG